MTTIDKFDPLFDYVHIIHPGDTIFKYTEQNKFSTVVYLSK